MLYDDKNEQINRMDEELEKLEFMCRKNNMRIFGLPEYEMSSEDLNRSIMDNVLKVACPDKTWKSVDILDAFRVGSRVNNQPRVTVVKSSNSTIKSHMYANRDALRANGIRISDDLTMRQRDKLKQLKDDGKTGYFQKGELKVREDRNDTSSNISRVFLNANRRLPQVNTQLNDHETMEHNAADMSNIDTDNSFDR